MSERPGLRGNADQAEKRDRCPGPPGVRSLAPPRVPDLEADFSGGFARVPVLQLREQLGLAQLKLLGPDGTVDLDLEHPGAEPERAAMGRDLVPDDLGPLAPDAVGERDPVETELAEHLPHQVTDGLHVPFAPTTGAPVPRHLQAPPAGSSRWSRKTIPVGIFGWKKVDFWGMTSPASVTRNTSSGVIGFR